MAKDEPKSALELAMEKLRARDEARGQAPPRKLTAEQKRKIAEVRSFYASKLAEREILYSDELKRAGFEPEKREEVEKAYLKDRERMERELASKLEGIRK